MTAQLPLVRTSACSFATYAAWFERPDVNMLVDQAAVETSQWLDANERSIDAAGKEVVEPWFDEVAFASPLPNEMAELERHYTLEIKAYEHGVGYFLKRLNDLEVLDIEYDKCQELVFLRSGELYSWLRYLVRMSWIDQSINLKEFRDSGDFSPTTPQAHARKKLLKAAELGIASVRRVNGSYNIQSGYVAKTFYEDVWYPVVKGLRPKIRKWSGS